MVAFRSDSWAQWFAQIYSILTLLRDPHRYVTAGATVMVGMLSLILAEGFLDRSFLLFREDLIRGHISHLQVLGTQEGDLIDSVVPAGSPTTRAIVERSLSSIPDALVTARLSISGLVSFGDRTIGFIGEGIEPAKDLTLSRAVVIDSGRSIQGDQGKEVILGEGLARSLGARVGDLVTLLVNTRSGSINAMELQVVGVFHSATKAYDDRALRLPLSSARHLYRVEGVSRLMILLPETEQTERAAILLRQALAGRTVEVKTWTQLADFYTKTVDLFSRQLNFVKGIIFAIVMLGIVNSTARNVLERTREIGTMMALGVRSRTIARRFVGESLLIGILGGFVGIALGALLAWLVSWIGIPMPPPPGNSHGFTGGVSFSLPKALQTFVGIVAICAVAALLPAWRVTRISIVDALRNG